MKLSTARRLVCMSYFTVDGLRPLLATATRIVCSGDSKRFLFPDGSVIESIKGNWKVVGMEKNEKLEAAVRRFGKAPFVTGSTKSDGVVGIVRAGEQILYQGPIDPSKEMFSTDEICKHFAVPLVSESLTAQSKAQRLEWHVAELQKMLNEKDEQLDKANRPMVVRLDWWAVALVGLVLIAHYVFKVL